MDVGDNAEASRWNFRGEDDPGWDDKVDLAPRPFKSR